MSQQLIEYGAGKVLAALATDTEYMKAMNTVAKTWAKALRTEFTPSGQQAVGEAFILAGIQTTSLIGNSNWPAESIANLLSITGFHMMPMKPEAKDVP